MKRKSELASRKNEWQDRGERIKRERERGEGEEETERGENLEGRHWTGSCEELERTSGRRVSLGSCRTRGRKKAMEIKLAGREKVGGKTEHGKKEKNTCTVA